MHATVWVSIRCPHLTVKDPLFLWFRLATAKEDNALGSRTLIPKERFPSRFDKGRLAVVDRLRLKEAPVVQNHLHKPLSQPITNRHSPAPSPFVVVVHSSQLYRHLAIG